MKQKHVILLFTLLAIGFVTLTATHNGVGIVSGYDCTGAESGLNNPTGCSCHSNTATTGVAIALELDSAGVPVTTYVPNMTYSVKLSGSYTLPYYGFQIGCIQGANQQVTPTNAGTWASTGLPANTQYSAAYNASYYVVNVVEQSAAIAGTGTGTTKNYGNSFTWTAPALGTGTISFWAVLNAVPGTSGSSNGAHWNTTHIVINERTCSNPTSATLSQTACKNYNFFGTMLTSTGTYTQHLTNHFGCDSLITLNLTVNTVNSTLTQSGSTLSAPSSSSYQWLDCNNNKATIAGATNQTFTPTASGNYAVALTQNGCTDTSACTAYTTAGINEVFNANSVAVYPNPTYNKLAVISQLSLVNASLKLINLTGQTIIEKQNHSGNQFTLDLSTQAAGIYFVEVQQSGAVWRGKVVKE